MRSAACWRRRGSRDGIAATRWIRAAPAAGEPGFSPDLRIVARATSALSGDHEARVAAGRDDDLAKPVQPDALRDILSRHLAPELAAAA